MQPPAWPLLLCTSRVPGQGPGSPSPASGAYTCPYTPPWRSQESLRGATASVAIQHAVAIAAGVLIRLLLPGCGGGFIVGASFCTLVDTSFGWYGAPGPLRPGPAAPVEGAEVSPRRTSPTFRLPASGGGVSLPMRY